MNKAKQGLDDAEVKRVIEQQKRKKLEEEQEKRLMLEQLARDKEERFGKKFDISGQQKKEITPLENVKYYAEAIVKLYPTFRCGSQAKDCLNVIKVAISNILKNPSEDKFKKIKMTNPTVKEKLGNIQLGLKLLKALGFIESGEFYVVEKVDTELFKQSLELLEKEVSKLSDK